MTHLRCGGKYVTRLVANLLPSPTVKVMNEYPAAHFCGPWCGNKKLSYHCQVEAFWLNKAVEIIARI